MLMREIDYSHLGKGSILLLKLLARLLLLRRWLLRPLRPYKLLVIHTLSIGLILATWSPCCDQPVRAGDTLQALGGSLALSLLLCRILPDHIEHLKRCQLGPFAPREIDGQDQEGRPDE